MSKLILPSPVVLASQSFDVDNAGATPAGTTLVGDGANPTAISPLRFLIPAYATTQDSSIDVEIVCTSIGTASATTYSLSPVLVFTDPDGVSNNVNYTAQAVTVQTATITDQIVRMSVKLYFARGRTGGPNEFRPLLITDSKTFQIGGGEISHLDTADFNTVNAPAMTRMDIPRAITVQLARSAGNVTHRTNVRSIRVVGYNLNMDNSTL